MLVIKTSVKNCDDTSLIPSPYPIMVGNLISFIFITNLSLATRYLFLKEDSRGVLAVERGVMSAFSTLATWRIFKSFLVACF